MSNDEFINTLKKLFSEGRIEIERNVTFDYHDDCVVFNVKIDGEIVKQINYKN